MLSTARTVIVDEIHAVAANKRGSHLALSLERLEALASPRTASRSRASALSATQKPIDEIARFLVGADRGRRATASRDCAIVDIGYARQRDLALEVPPSPLEAVMSDDQWEQVYAAASPSWSRASHDARLRQHAAHGRARGAPSGRAARPAKRSRRTTAAWRRKRGSRPSSG